MSKKIYTIGYSGYGNQPEQLIKELQSRGINVLIDVRSNPYSARFDGYNKEKFKKTLNNAGIIYRHYAKYFGAKQENSDYYSKFDGEEDRIDYDIFTKSDDFKQGVKNLERIVAHGLIPVLMCSEKDPIDCHRAIMIGRVLTNKEDFYIAHIVPGRSDESQSDLETRIMNNIKQSLEHKKKLNTLETRMKDKLELAKSLFANPENTAYTKNIDNYYRLENARIGWTRKAVLGYKK